MSSWTYFGDQWDEYLNDPYDLSPTDEYCNICNWATYSTSIMSRPGAARRHISADTKRDFIEGIAIWGPFRRCHGSSPAASTDGHPASSKLILFEGFVKKIVDAVEGQPRRLWAHCGVDPRSTRAAATGTPRATSQPVDFFAATAPAFPMIAVSPFSTGPGHISHTYTDHVFDG